MTLLWTPEGTYERVDYESEAEIERAIQEVKEQLFGADRIYLEVKKKIGPKGGKRNIPDGYLLDLTGSSPRLFVVEAELSSHEPLRHIAVQILEFSLAFEAEPRMVKKVLFNALQAHPAAAKRGEEYARDCGLRNLDNMLEWLVFDSPFAALIIIDEIPENLENVLAKKFAFGVEVIELRKYQSSTERISYRFEPFLAGLETTGPLTTPRQPSERQDPASIDTVVVPARDEGFEEVFVGENCWHAVRLHGSMRPQIRHIAAYRVAPISAITHLAQVESIEPWKDSGKFVVNFAEPAKAIGPIPFVKGGHLKSFQSLRYTSLEKLKAAKTLDDIW